MLFRYTGTVHDVFVARNDVLAVTAGEIHLTITKEPHPRVDSKSVLLITATSELDVPDALVDDVQAIVDRDPSASNRVEQSADMTAFALSVSSELSAAARQAAATLSWAQNVQVRRPSSLGLTMSVDGIAWRPVGTSVSVIVQVPNGLTLDPSRAEVAKSLIEGGQTRPLAHDLLKEAESLVSDSQRSALVIGVAALEVGFKSLVATLVPHADWLVTNIQAPPLHRMLRDYLPQLPVRLQFAIDGVDQIGATPLPQYVLSHVKRAVERRNEVSHRGAESVDHQWLLSFLHAASDVLYTFDLYAGQAWAIGQLSEEYRVALAIEARPAK